MIRKRKERWQAVLKSGRTYVSSATFDTKREAQEWLARQSAALAGGIDPRAGKVHVGTALEEWLAAREPQVARKTFKTDTSMTRQIPTWFRQRELGSVAEADIERLTGQWTTRYAHSTVTRYRAILSRFFGWSVRNRMRLTNPVTEVRVPRPQRSATEMLPLSRAELDEVVEAIRPLNQRTADCVLFLALTGLRWGEARSLRVADVHQVPMPRLFVSRSQPESTGAPKSTKSGRSRFVPLTHEALAVVNRLSAERLSSDLLLTTTRGAQLHRTAFVRSAHWDETGKGRRIHDLRHTAATLWLDAGTPLTTVKQWLGHADIATTQKYVHWLGTDADRAAIDRLNSAGGDTGVTTTGSQQGNSLSRLSESNR